MPLDCGTMMREITMAYNTYGTLNADKSNAILVCHALTGDQYAASQQPVTGKEGWWNIMIGPGRVLDTDRYFIVCSNVLGGCMGTTGPRDINPETGKAYDLAQRWPGADLRMVDGAGHALSEPGISAELVRIMNYLRTLGLT